MTVVDRNEARRQLREEAKAQLDALCKAVNSNVSSASPRLPASVEKLATASATLMAKQMATADVSGLTAMVEEAGSTHDEHERERLMKKILQEADRIQENGMSNVDAVTNQICTLICQVPNAVPSNASPTRLPARKNATLTATVRAADLLAAATVPANATTGVTAIATADADDDWGGAPCINHILFTGWFPFQFTFRDFSPSLRSSPTAKNETPFLNVAHSSPTLPCSGRRGSSAARMRAHQLLSNIKSRCRPPAGEVTRSTTPSATNRRRKEKEKLRMRSKPNRAMAR